MARHPIHRANEHSPYGDLTRAEFYRVNQVHHHEEHFMLNKNHNLKIFTQSWQPESDGDGSNLRGLVAMVHGYSAESGWIFELTAVSVARLGFHVVALDLPGHGRSEGRRGHLPDITVAVDACTEFFDSTRASHRVEKPLPAFLYGESLGGAIAMLVYLRQKAEWTGLVLNGAMCGVSSEFKPVWPLEKFLPLMAFFFPSCPVLTKPLTSCSYKEEWKRRLFDRSPNFPQRWFSGRPPAATALEMIRVIEEVWRRSSELELPLLVVHGGSDSVCDSESARALYDRAPSQDKTLRVLPGMWHQLVGEPEEGVDSAFGIVFSWLVDRVDKANSVARDKVYLEV